MCALLDIFSMVLYTIEKLLYHLSKIRDRTTIKNIRETKIGEQAVIIGVIESFGMKQARKRRYFQMLLKQLKKMH